MSSPPATLTLPDPGDCGPRIGGATTDWMQLPTPSLQGALVALVGRDTSSLSLSAAQRLSHFPASPLVSISWYQGLEAGLIHGEGDRLHWQPFGADAVISGSQSRPTVSWAPTTGSGYMACFNADAAQALFDLDLSVIQDQFLPVDHIRDPRLAALRQALSNSTKDNMMAVLDQHLGARWQAHQGRASGKPSIRELGRNWVDRLAWQAQSWSRVHSARHVERRIKSFSGRSLREWQTLVRTEGLFFAARDRYESGLALDWAALAQEEGFADQAHMSRLTKRITGFTPTQFAQRFIEDESFWMYRLWI